MYAEYQTDRLVLKLLTPNYCKDVLEFHRKNKEVFEKYEPMHPAAFYTYAYQHNILKCEYKMAQKLESVRYHVFLKSNPYTIIGTVCLHNITHAPYDCCEIGYKFDMDVWHRGYAREAVSKAVYAAFYDLRLHRVFARVSLDNAPSIRLLKSLHFVNEGIEYASIQIQGVWTDHIRFALLRPF